MNGELSVEELREAIKKASGDFNTVIMELPAGPDRTAALLYLKIAKMLANATMQSYPDGLSFGKEPKQE